ncbi:MAG: hypothetical protein ACRD2N_03500 [Vicinamibacterales bacterium]
MTRVLAVALAFSLGDTATALAAGGLLEAASRIARQHVQFQAGPVPTPSPARIAQLPARAQPPWKVRGDDVRRARDASQGPSGLASSGMSKGRKFAIAIGLVAGFAGIVYVVDHAVEDSTPSSLGER